MIPQEPRVKQKVRSLKNPRLRKVRYELRTLLFLLFEEKKMEIYQKMGDVRRDDSISFDGKKERNKLLLKEEESLILSFIQCPINCSLCGCREEDLIYQLDNHMWVCHNRKECNRRRIQNIQVARKMIRERLSAQL